MTKIFDIKSEQFIEKEIKDIFSRYTRIKGISFVGSFKIIETVLMPQFSQIDLILGMEDYKTGQNLEQMFDISRRTSEVVDASEEFLSRILDQTVQLHFTKDKLFHTKLFILTNEQGEFAVLNGSMNLTQKAMTQNHEMMWLYEGIVGIDDLVYTEHLNLFNNYFENESVPYIDRKLIESLFDLRSRGTDADEIKKEITAVLSDQIIDDIDAEIVIDKADITSAIEKDETEDVTTYQVNPEVVEVLQTVYTKTGNRRQKKAPEKVRESLKQISYKIYTSKKNPEQVENFTQFEQPKWLYDQDDEIIVMEDKPLMPTNASREDLEVFVQMISTYEANKVSDERQQIMTAFLYVLTSPLIWKIRDIWSQNDLPREEIPITLALLGQGRSGKSHTLTNYIKPFIGDQSKIILYDNLPFADNGRQMQKTMDYIDEYMTSEVISPFILDEVKETYFDSAIAIRKHKYWSNNDRKLHGTLIYASNANGASMKPELTKRVLYIPIVSRFKRQELQRFDYMDIKHRLNSNLYQQVLSELNHRLLNLTESDKELILQDYLGITKDILKRLLTQHGLINQLPDFVWETYEFTGDYREKWTLALRNDRFENVTFSPTEDKTVSISREVFMTMSDKAQAIDKIMEDFYNALPAGVGIKLLSNGMILDIDEFDHYLRSNEIRNYYRMTFNLDEKEQQQENQEATTQLMSQMLELQKEQLARQAESEQIKAELNELKNKRGLFSRIFGGK